MVEGNDHSTATAPLALLRRNRIRRIGPENSRKVMKRDAGTPAVGRRPDQYDAERGQQRQTERAMRSADAEVNQGDDRRDRQPIADDRERPRVSWIPFVDEAADLAALEVMGPPREQAALAAVRAALSQSASQRLRNGGYFNPRHWFSTMRGLKALDHIPKLKRYSSRRTSLYHASSVSARP